MFMDSVGQKFRKIIMETVGLCSAMSGASASKNQTDGGDENTWWLESSGSIFTCVSGTSPEQPS